MTIRPIDSRGPSAASEVSSSTAATPTVAERHDARSSFDPAVRSASETRLRGDAGQQPLAGSILPGEPQPVAPGPLSLRSRAAQDALATASQFVTAHLRLGGSRDSATPEFQPRLVEVDNLGMTHVRLDRVQDGVPVLGEQVIVHLDRDGKPLSMTGAEQLAPIPLDVARAGCECTKDQALAIAQQAFGKKSQHEPVVEEVLVRGEDGRYARAYRVELTDFRHDRPERMNYLVGGHSGAVLDSWNQMGGIELPTQRGDVVGRPGRSDTITVSKTAEPNAQIDDLGTVTSKLTLDDEVSVEQVKLELDIPHTWKGDLTVTLTSPTGKQFIVHDRAGGSGDDVKGSFDVSSAFAGEQAKGEWTLTVEDHAKLDVGTLRSWGLAVTGRGAPKPQGDDASLYSGNVDLSTTRNPDGSFKLLDPTRGKGVQTQDAQNKSSGGGAIDFVDTDDTWGETDDPAKNRAAVDAHYGAQSTYDFYRDVLGRDSIDGKGEQLVSNVHIRTRYVNAYWDGKTMNYGDGDGKTAGPLTTLDIAGHEITHGLTERTAGLIYRGESGGINESMSDILGTGVEWYASRKNSAVKFDYAVGEDAWTPANGDPDDALRYMDDPTKDGYSVDHYSDYPKQTEVHGSSGIMNNAFFLLAEGGTNRTSGMEVEGGIGAEDAFRIYGRALMFYMTPNTNFAAAREACVKAATDLFGAGSVQVEKVRQSWSAVGVM